MLRRRTQTDRNTIWTEHNGANQDRNVCSDCCLHCFYSSVLFSVGNIKLKHKIILSDITLILCCDWLHHTHSHSAVEWKEWEKKLLKTLLCVCVCVRWSQFTSCWREGGRVNDRQRLKTDVFSLARLSRNEVRLREERRREREQESRADREEREEKGQGRRSWRRRQEVQKVWKSLLICAACAVIQAGLRQCYGVKKLRCLGHQCIYWSLVNWWSNGLTQSQQEVSVLIWGTHQDYLNLTWPSCFWLWPNFRSSLALSNPGFINSDFVEWICFNNLNGTTFCWIVTSPSVINSKPIRWKGDRMKEWLTGKTPDRVTVTRSS